MQEGSHLNLSHPLPQFYQLGDSRDLSKEVLELYAALFPPLPGDEFWAVGIPGQNSEIMAI